MSLNDGQRLRYARHLLLNEWGETAQEAVCNATALIIGAGGLGCPAALYLAASGVGHLVVADADTVDTTNLQRQIAHSEATVGIAKVDSLQRAVHALHGDCRFTGLNARADAALLDEWVPRATVVLDCSDNFETRHAVNAACVKHRVPLVSGAAIRWDGQVSVFDARQADAPCYHCLFPDGESLEETRCATLGVFAPLVGVVGSLQAAEALKCIAGVGQTLSGRLLMISGDDGDVHSVRVRKDPHCAVCCGPATASV